MKAESIERINELARKAKSPEGLTAAEKAEQQKLRSEYVAAFRASLQAQLDNVRLVDEDGNQRPLEKKKPVLH